MSWGYGSASVELVGGKPGVMEGWIEVGLKVRNQRESWLEGLEILEGGGAGRGNRTLIGHFRPEACMCVGVISP